MASDEPKDGTLQKIEDFRAGYPQFSALIGSHYSFNVFRRFLRTRARMLLLKQDEVSLLESQLDRVDKEETRELFLGNARRDVNPKRIDLLTKLDVALFNYDSFLERTRVIMAYAQPRSEDVLNLQNWIGNTSSLAEEETLYLSQRLDLMTLCSSSDDAIARLLPVVESLVRTIYRFLKKPPSSISQDPKISVLPTWLLQRLTRLLVALIIIILLLAPVIVVNALSSTTLRLVSIVIATTILVAVIATFTDTRVFEILVSGATYATVLVVFISGGT